MKEIKFTGNSLKCLRGFPEDAKPDAGFQLRKVQNGEMPDDFKHMPSIGKGVIELRIWDEMGTFRVVYLSMGQDMVYVLHAFKKKTEQTAKSDIDLCKERLKEC